MIQAYAIQEKGKELTPFEFDPGELKPDEVEVQVISCGICHSDLSMIQNDWGISEYPLVPGHEVIGQIVKCGSAVPNHKEGDMVGVGWSSRNCLYCRECLSGQHNRCKTINEDTIVGRHGGFASHIRCQWLWAIPIPEGLDPIRSGPLLCGGITVFNPMIHHNLQPTGGAGVIGIGGLGHMAIRFLKAWGCEVIAFSSNESKTEEIKNLGAHEVVNSRNPDEIRKWKRSIDLLISTVNVSLDWTAYLETVRPGGALHTVGAVPDPIAIHAMHLIDGERSISGSPTGGPQTMNDMLEFCARHEIQPVTEEFPMSKANEALEHLKSGNARYRIVLKADF